MASVSPAQFKLAQISSNYISSLGRPQQQVLWIGCSDSGFEETEILDLLPNEMIVMRDIGNMVIDDGSSCSSMMQYALEILKVQHIIICGHYGCGIIRTGAGAALKEPWLSTLDHLWTANQADLAEIESNIDRDRRLVELNVAEQMQFLRQWPMVKNAIEERGLRIHGLVFDRPNNVSFEVPESPVRE